MKLWRTLPTLAIQTPPLPQRWFGRWWGTSAGRQSIGWCGCLSSSQCHGRCSPLGCPVFPSAWSHPVIFKSEILLFAISIFNLLYACHIYIHLVYVGLRIIAVYFYLSKTCHTFCQKCTQSRRIQSLPFQSNPYPPHWPLPYLPLTPSPPSLQTNPPANPSPEWKWSNLCKITDGNTSRKMPQEMKYSHGSVLWGRVKIHSFWH